MEKYPHQLFFYYLVKTQNDLKWRTLMEKAKSNIYFAHFIWFTVGPKVLGLGLD